MATFGVESGNNMTSPALNNQTQAKRWTNDLAPEWSF